MPQMNDIGIMLDLMVTLTFPMSWYADSFFWDLLQNLQIVFM